jgi:hypothetical protein
MPWNQTGSCYRGENGWEVRRVGGAYDVVCTAGSFRWCGRRQKLSEAKHLAEQTAAQEFLDSTSSLPSAEPEGGFPDPTEKLGELMQRLATLRG